MKNNLLIFGCDFFPQKKTSEINVWNDLVEYFRDFFDEVVILSVNNRPIRREKLHDNVYLYNVKPHYFYNHGKWFDPEYSGHPFHKLPMAVFYKTYSFLQYQSIFDQIIDDHDIGIVHYMRIFGVFNKLLINRHPKIYFTMTVPTHVDRGFPLHLIYHQIKNMSIKSMDRIVPTCSATEQRLLSLGIPSSHMKVIPWSLDFQSSGSLTSIETAGLRKKLDLPNDNIVVLWSGPIQGTGKKELMFALEVAKHFTSTSDRCTFVFAFKPDGLSTEYLDAGEKIQSVRLLETDRALFQKLISVADIFLSPVCSYNRTVAPPLTWIEMMWNGVPVLTTPVDGADEIIMHCQNGMILDDVAQTVNVLKDSNAETFNILGKQAENFVKDKYEPLRIARQYVDMWRSGIERKCDAHLFS